MTAGPPREKKLMGPLVCAALYLSLSAASVISHDFWRDSVESEKRAAIHTAILAGHAKAPGQYRLMIPVAAAGLQELGLSFRASVVLLRFVFTALSALLLHSLLRRWFREEICLIGTLLLFAYLPLTHIIYQMAWTDAANFAFTLLALILIAERRDAWLAPLLALSMFNRETMLLIPLVWLLFRWDELPPLRCAAVFAGYCGIAFAVYFGLRDHYGPIPHAGAEFFEERGLTPLQHNLTFARGYGYVAVWLGVLVALALRGFSAKPKFMRRTLLFVPFFALFHVFVAVFLEPRLMLPIFPMVLAPALASLADARDEPVPETRTLPGLLRAPRILYVSVLLAFAIASHSVGYRLTHAALPFASNEAPR